MSNSADMSKYEVDGTAPQRATRPTSLEQLSATLTEAHAAGDAVIPLGGGTNMHIGNLPERYTIALDMTGLAGNVEHEPGDLTVVADAGVTIASLQKTLSSAGQRLPFDVADPDAATLGGSVASNASGQLRSSLGGIRDWVIGMKVVLADGTVTKSGGRVVKNVQGYDLYRLHTGAFGTLGVIAEVALKIIPVPPSTSTIAAWFASITEAGEFTMQVFNGPIQPEAMTLFVGDQAAAAISSLSDQADDGPPVLVLARVAGGKAAVTRMETDLTGSAGALGATGYEIARGRNSQKLWKTAGSVDPNTALSARTTLKPRDAIAYLDELSDKLPERFSGELQAGFGTVGVSLSEASSENITTLRDAASKRGAQAVIEHCPAALKRDIDVFGDTAETLALARSVKQRFDPQRVLNPGRFAGRI